MAGWWLNPNSYFAYLDFISLQETVFSLLEQSLIKWENWAVIENKIGSGLTSSLQSQEDQPWGANIVAWSQTSLSYFLETFFLVGINESRLGEMWVGRGKDIKFLLWPWINGASFSTPRSLELAFFKKTLFIFRERGREGEREGERHQCMVAS